MSQETELPELVIITTEEHFGTKKFSEEHIKKLSESHKGHIHSEEHKRKIGEAGKGHITSEETRRKIGEGNRGKVRSEETKIKLSLSHIGKILSEEQKIKISKALKGIKHSDEHNKKVAEALRSEERRRKMSEIHKGHITSEETKRKISKTETGKLVSEETKKKLKEIQNSDEHKKKLAEKSKQGEFESMQELDIQDQLLKQKIYFESHKYIKDLLPGRYKYHKWDIVIEELKVLIEVQGCYFHWCPECHPNSTPKDKKILDNMERDKIIIPIAKSKGWKVVEIWEHTIKNSEIQFKI